jgi:hypothetical protein
MLAELRRDTAAHRKARNWKQSLVRTLSFFALLLLANGMRAQQPAEPVDPTPINGGTYYFINQLSAMQMDLNTGYAKRGDPILQESRALEPSRVIGTLGNSGTVLPSNQSQTPV